MGVQGALGGVWVKRQKPGVGGRSGLGGMSCSQGSHAQRREDGVDQQDGGWVCFPEPGGRGWKALVPGEGKSWDSCEGASIFFSKRAAEVTC